MWAGVFGRERDLDVDMVEKVAEWQRTGRTEWRKVGVINVSFVEWRDSKTGETIMLPNLVHPEDQQAEIWSKRATSTDKD